LAKCPKCGSNVSKPLKNWELRGGKSRKAVKIGLFVCPKCKMKFRGSI